MYVILDCAGCGRTFKTKAEYAGKRVECPACRRVIQIPPSPSIAPGGLDQAAEAPPFVAVEETIVPAPPPIETTIEAPLLPRTVQAPPPVPPPIPAANTTPLATFPAAPPNASGGPYAPGYAPAAPPLAVYGTPPAMAHRLTPVPIGQFLLWNFLTFNIFGAIYLNLLHGRMPRLRHNDPSAGQAIGFLFIPFFNLYWMFFTYLRLVERLDEQRAMRGMRPSGVRQLALYNCVLTIVCMFLWFLFVPSLIQWLFLFPWFFTLMVRHVNALVEVTGELVGGQLTHSADAAAIIARAEDRAAREFSSAWGVALYVLSGVLAAIVLVIGILALIVAVAPRPPQPDAPDKLPGVICLLFFAALVAIPAALTFRKGRRMRAV